MAVQVPLGWLLMYRLDWGEKGIFSSILCVEMVYAACIIFLYAGRAWLRFGLRKKKSNG